MPMQHTFEFPFKYSAWTQEECNFPEGKGQEFIKMLCDGIEEGYFDEYGDSLKVVTHSSKNSRFGEVEFIPEKGQLTVKATFSEEWDELDSYDGLAGTFSLPYDEVEGEFNPVAVESLAAMVPFECDGPGVRRTKTFNYSLSEVTVQGILCDLDTFEEEVQDASQDIWKAIDSIDWAGIETRTGV